MSDVGQRRTIAIDAMSIDAFPMRVPLILKTWYSVDRFYSPCTAPGFSFAGCVRGYLHGAEKRMEDFERTVDTMLDEMKQEIFSKLDFIAAVASKCLLVSIKGDNPCPRLISVEEDVTHTSTLSKFSHFRRKAMDPLRRALGKTKTQQSKPKRYRVRFLCAYDMSAAECGPDGQGYIVESEKDWQRWLQKCLPLVQVSFCKQLATRRCGLERSFF